MSILSVFVFYLIAINLLGVASMFSDKRKARKRAFRIPESTLFLIAALGGSPGSLFGMYLFRHKTKHRKFTVGIPLLLLFQILLLGFILYYFLP